MTMPIPPNCVADLCTACLTATSSATSHGMASPPISSAKLSIAATLRARRATRRPIWTKSRAVASPICGKVTRAEPAAQIYEEGRAHHIGSFAKLEDQMAEFTIDFDRKASGYSPDRVDALVWAFTELLVEPIAGEGIFELYRQQAAKAAAAKAERERKPAPTPQPGSVEWFEMMKKRQQSQ